MDYNEYMKHGQPVIRKPVTPSASGGTPYDDGLQAAPPNPAGLETNEEGKAVRHDYPKMTEGWKEEQPPRRTYCGLRPMTFWLGIVILVLLAAALAIGLGVGLSKGGNQRSNGPSPVPASTTSPQATKTVTVTTSIGASPTATAVNGGCRNGTKYTSTNNTPFSEFCETDFNVGSSWNTTAADLPSGVSTLTFAGCMDACALFRSANIIFSDTAGTCLAVTWQSTGIGFGNCFMKNATALTGSSNKTALMLHAHPNPNVDLQSANIVNSDGQIL